MNNPIEILLTLDQHLTKATELTVFGRSALALGYPRKIFLAAQPRVLKLAADTSG